MNLKLEDIFLLEEITSLDKVLGMYADDARLSLVWLARGGSTRRLKDAGLAVKRGKAWHPTPEGLDYLNSAEVRALQAGGPQ